MTITDDDKLWRDQTIPDVSDDDLSKIVQTFGVSKEQHQETFEKQLTEKYHFKSMKDNKEIWYYDDTKGIYCNNANWLIEQACIKDNPDVKTNSVNDIVNRIIWSNYADRTAFDPDIEWLCFKNVMVNILTGECKEHSPDFMATIQIPHNYVNLHRTPHIPTPQNIFRFFHDVMPSPADVETVLDFMAYCLWRNFQFHKWLLFNGSGRNGKGVTTELITRLFGEDNVSNETLQRITGRDFATSGLYGKMINIDADLSSEALRETGTLKKLTGADWITAEYKFKNAFHFKSYAKLIFSANKMPITPDESDAYFARPIMIPFPNQYLGDKADPDLIDKLVTEEEMSSLLSLLLRRLPRVLKYGVSLKKSDDIIQDNYMKYKESSDPIGLFIELCITKTRTENNYWTLKDEVYDAYQEFCIDKNLPKESVGTFGRRLKEEGFKDKQKRLDGFKDRPYVWLDVMLKNYRQTEKDQTTLDNEEVS